MAASRSRASGFELTNRATETVRASAAVDDQNVETMPQALDAEARNDGKDAAEGGGETAGADAPRVVRKTAYGLYLYEDQVKALKRRAFEEDRSASEVARELFDKMLDLGD